MAGETRVLFISNGYGEDNIAAHIAGELQHKYPTLTVSGFPTVGSGRFYNENSIPLAGEGIRMPSEGFVRSAKDLLRDMSRGLFIKTLRMGRRLRAAAGNSDFLVVTGDPYLLLFTSLFTRTGRSRKVFVGTLQSEWYGSRRPFKEHYSAVERLWLKWFCRLIIARDMKTAHYLNSRGLGFATSFGNPMMDCLVIPKQRFLPEDRTVIGILPGSKREAYDNFGKITETAVQLVRSCGERRKLLFAVALSANLDIEELVSRNRLSKVGAYERAPVFTVYRTEKNGLEFLISTGCFENIISESDAVIGLSGTGNEQAAGLGKPVFGFWGKGPQITKKFMKAQKRLLGPSLFIFPPQPSVIAQKIDEVLDDAALKKRIKENGRLRMGGKGSVESIAEKIGSHLKSI
jgi:uncharacterized protein (TIGR03492 family)